MSIDFIRPEVDELRPRISVIGVGGAGGLRACGFLPGIAGRPQYSSDTTHASSSSGRLAGIWFK